MDVDVFYLPTGYLSLQPGTVKKIIILAKISSVQMFLFYSRSQHHTAYTSVRARILSPML